MMERVFFGLPAVPAAADDFPFANNHRAHRHLALLRRLLGETERCFHIFLLFCHLPASAPLHQKHPSNGGCFLPCLYWMQASATLYCCVAYGHRLCARLLHHLTLPRKVHRSILHAGQVLQAVARAVSDTGNRFIRDVGRDAGLGRDQFVEAPDQRTAAGHHDCRWSKYRRSAQAASAR